MELKAERGGYKTGRERPTKITTSMGTKSVVGKKVQACGLSYMIGASFLLVWPSMIYVPCQTGAMIFWGGKWQQSHWYGLEGLHRSQCGEADRGEEGRQPFWVKRGESWEAEQHDDYHHMHQKASHWSQSAGYGFWENSLWRGSSPRRKETINDFADERARPVSAPDLGLLASQACPVCVCVREREWVRERAMCWSILQG